MPEGTRPRSAGQIPPGLTTGIPPNVPIPVDFVRVLRSEAGCRATIDAALVREWGRIGRRGRRLIGLHRDRKAAEEELSAWLTRKVRRGYALR